VRRQIDAVSNRERKNGLNSCVGTSWTQRIRCPKGFRAEEKRRGFNQSVEADELASPNVVLHVTSVDTKNCAGMRDIECICNYCRQCFHY
jgi:hypothetical protein